jgi:hypothetical protein
LFSKYTKKRKQWGKSKNIESDPAVSAASGLRPMRVLEIVNRHAEPRNANGNGTSKNVRSGTKRTVFISGRYISVNDWKFPAPVLLNIVHQNNHHPG